MTPPARRGVAVAFALALGALVLLPGGSGLPGDPTIDVWTHAWGLDWVARSLASGALPTATDLLAHPRGGTLTPADPFGALLVAPVTLALGAARAMWAEVWLQLLLAALAGWAYGEALGRGGGPVGAVVCATSPTFLAEVHNGILEANWIGLVALAGAAAARGHRATPWIVAVAGLASPYHGVAATAVAACHLVARGERRALAASVIAGALGVGLATAGLRLGFGGDVPLEIKAPGLQEPTLRINAVDPRDFGWPGDHWTVRTELGAESRFRRTAYLGWTLLILAAVGARRSPGAPLRLLVCALAMLAALGPYLWWGDNFFRTGGGARLALPLRAAYTAGIALDHPLRFLGAAIVLLGGLAATGAGRFGPVAAAVVLAENLLFAPNVWPLVRSAAEVPEVYARLPDDGRAVIDLPAQVGNTMRTGAYLYWQTSHRRPLPYTLKPSARVPSANAALRRWLALSSGGPPPAAPGMQLVTEDPVGALAREGYGWVVLHPSMCPDEAAVRRHLDGVGASLGAPREVAGAWVWEISEAAAR